MLMPQISSLPPLRWCSERYPLTPSVLRERKKTCQCAVCVDKRGNIIPTAYMCCNCSRALFLGFFLFSFSRALSAPPSISAGWRKKSLPDWRDVLQYVQCVPELMRVNLPLFPCYVLWNILYVEHTESSLSPGALLTRVMWWTHVKEKKEPRSEWGRRGVTAGCSTGGRKKNIHPASAKVFGTHECIGRELRPKVWTVTEALEQKMRGNNE